MELQKFLIEENSLLPPLSALQGVGSNAAINIVAAREHGEFSSKACGADHWCNNP